MELSVLPLPDPPVLLIKVILQFHLSEDRFEHPRLQFRDHRRTIDLADPLNRLLQPEDTAEAALFLATAEARSITGINVSVNAGTLIA